MEAGKMRERKKSFGREMLKGEFPVRTRKNEKSFVESKEVGKN
jgi:hypothetical protein